MVARGGGSGGLDRVYDNLETEAELARFDAMSEEELLNLADETVRPRAREPAPARPPSAPRPLPPRDRAHAPQRPRDPARPPYPPALLGCPPRRFPWWADGA